MVDETDVSREVKWFYEERAKAAVANLLKRDINAQYVSTRQEAFSAVTEMIPDGARVACGDSTTLEQVGIIDALRKRSGIKFFDTQARTEDGFYVLDWKARFNMQRKAFFADVFLTGTNAVTLDGKLVNIDGLGNRVAPMIFGPKNVIVVAGANKIVKDVDAALERIHQVAAPMIGHRHYLKHRITGFANLPCVRTGRCPDCNHKWKMCVNTVIIERTVKGRMNVVLVGEALGI